MAKYVRKSPERQADEVARAVSSYGTKRADEDVQGASVGSIETYTPTWRDAAAFIQEVHMSGNAGKNFPAGLREMDAKTAGYYLNERAEHVGQATLNSDRLALEAMIKTYGNGDEKLEKVFSDLPSGKLATGSRYYTKDQISDVSKEQSDRNALATRVAAEAGLRAHELTNIRRYDEAEKAGDIDIRKYSENRFAGADNRTERYVVTGKGGLTREVRLAKETAQALEKTRREHPTQIVDRNINYWSRYDIGSGRAWSQSYTSASKKALNWTRGAHGTRHSYAQERMKELRALGLSFKEALHAVSNEMGHLSPNTTLYYLR
jgi:integrase